MAGWLVSYGLLCVCVWLGRGWAAERRLTAALRDGNREKDEALQSLLHQAASRYYLGRIAPTDWINLDANVTADAKTWGAR